MSDNLRVLYAEDEVDIRAVAEFALEDEGFELTQCTNGQEAIDKAQGKHFDLILLDVMMPGLDGPTTLGRLRALPQLADIPAIFMTAKVQAAEVEQYKAMGAVGVIPKPFDAMTLADDIRRMLDKRSG